MTGQDKSEGHAHIRIWDSLSLTTLKVMGLNGKDFTISVSCLSFSKVDGGKHLCAVDDGSDRWLSVWNWSSGQKTASAKCYGDLVFAAEFHPTDKNMIVTCGKGHIYFWHLDDANHLTKKSGVFDVQQSTVVTSASGASVPANFKLEKPKYILCLAFSSVGEVISGDSEGNIIFWSPRENKIVRLIRDAHESGIFTILYVQNQNNSLNLSGDSQDSHNSSNLNFQV